MLQNIRKMNRFFVWSVLILALSVPFFLNAEDGNEVNQGTTTGRFTPCEGTSCTLQDLISVIGELMKFLIELAIPVSTIAFVWAGFLYITALDDSGKVTKAKNIFKNVALGLGLMLAAWVIVNTVLVALFKTDAYIPFLG